MLPIYVVQYIFNKDIYFKYYVIKKKTYIINELSLKCKLIY